MSGNNFGYDGESLYITRSGYTGEDGASDDAINCNNIGMSLPVETDGDGPPDVCHNQMTGAVIDDCEPLPMGGHCECEPCTGYPKGRDDLCEGDFITCGDQTTANGTWGAWCDDACKNSPNGTRFTLLYNDKISNLLFKITKLLKYF